MNNSDLRLSVEVCNLNTFEIRDNNYELMAGDRYSDFLVAAKLIMLSSIRVSS